MIQFWIYIAGVLTTITIITSILSFYYYNKVKDIEKQSNNKIDSLNQKLNKLNDIISSRTKRATLTWENWYYQKDPKKKWIININLIQKSISKDNTNLVQFNIESIISSNQLDTNTDEYRNKFFEYFIDGWIDISNMKNPNTKFNWVTTKDKQDERNDKILDILSDENKDDSDNKPI